MATENYSNGYRDVLFAGPFFGKLDPWAEEGRYFHQIHAGLIGVFLEYLRAPLFDLGYFAGREASLQIAEQGDPDFFIREEEHATPDVAWSYETAATQVHAEPGILLSSDEPDLDALYIKHLESGDLVTVVEVISPSNKSDRLAAERYITRRSHLVYERHVNLVELDLTRSVKRLLVHKSVDAYPYHIAIYLPTEQPRLIGLELEEPIKRFALPLRNEVLGVNTQPLYDQAYQQASIALQLQKDDRYHEERLPFPSLLTDEQRQQALTAVTTWRNRLSALKNEGSE